MQKRCGQEENLPIYWYDSRNPLRSVCMLKDTCVGVDFVSFMRMTFVTGALHGLGEEMQ